MLWIPRSSNRFVNAFGKEQMTSCRDAGVWVAPICFGVSIRWEMQGERHEYEHDHPSGIRRRPRHRDPGIAEIAAAGGRLGSRDLCVGGGVSRSSATPGSDLP